MGGGANPELADLDLKHHRGIGDDATNLTGRTLADLSIIDANSLHILFFGQSNNNNSVQGGAYTILNPTKMLNMSVGHRGKVFYAKDPLLSSDYNSQSHAGIQLADQLISAGTCSNVIVSNVSIGASFCADWVPRGAFAWSGFRAGDLAYRIGLAQRCIVAAGLDNVRTVIDWAQGEWDSDSAANATTYAAQLNAVIAEMKQTRLLRPGRVLFVHQTTRSINTTANKNAIRAGQAAVVDGGLVRAGVDMDAIGGRGDGVHFNQTGAGLFGAARKTIIQSWIASG